MDRRSEQPPRRRGRTTALAALATAAALAAFAAFPGDSLVPSVVQTASQELRLPIVAASDDATERLADGSVELQSADLELGEDADSQLVGLRFQQVDISPGAVVTSAYVQFASARYTDGPSSLVLAGQASDHALQFARVVGDLSGRTTTDAVVEWEPEPWFGVGELGIDQRSADVTAVVAEIVGRPGWESGNALALLISGSGSRAAESFDGPLGLPPVLHVDFDEPSESNSAPTVEAGVDRQVELTDTVTLFGVVSDDGNPATPGAVTSVWTVLQGPSPALIADPTAARTTVRFTEPGIYTFSLVADDGEIAREATLTVTVTDPSALPPPTRFAIIGDFGEPGPGEAAVAALVTRLQPEFVVTVGDNVYVPNIDDAVGGYYSSYIGDYAGSVGQGASVNRFFPSIGNHEYTDPTGGIADYLEYFTLPGAGVESSDTSGNERYYDFVQGPVHFFVLNSNTGEPDGRNATSVQARWLERQLAASTAPWKIVVSHHPPFSSARGTGQTPVLRWPFAAWGADAVVSGHSHVYERLSSNDVLYLVNGIGGEGASSFDAESLPETRYRYNGGLGAVLVEACAARIEFSLHTVNEGVLDTHALGATDCSGARPVDQTPFASAGPDMTVDRAGPTSLRGIVADDGDVSARWSQVTGPGAATFSDPDQANAMVTFSLPGPYVLRLEASDGGQVGSDDIEVFVADQTYGIVDVAVQAGADDAEQRLATGSVQVNSTDLGLGVGSQSQLVGLRFANLRIPAGAVVQRAHVQFETDEVSTDGSALTISAERSENARAFSASALDVSARPTTTATVDWRPPAWLRVRASGTEQRTPDLTELVQQVVDLPGWSTGNAFALIISGTGTRLAESADGNAGGAPVLHVEYLIP